MYKKITAMVALMLVFSVLSPQVIQANQAGILQDGGDDEVITHVNPNAGKKPMSWSTADLASAQPMPLGKKDGKVPADTGDIIPMSSGLPQFSYPAKPGGNVQTITVADSSSISYTPYIRNKYPPLFTRHAENANVDIYPISTMGVLFFTQNGVGYRCSAVLVYRNVVWTAGHCIHDGATGTSGWSSDFVFYPAWKSGAANPLYGSYNNWTASKIGGGWANGHYGADYGAVVFDDTVGGGYPGDTIGYMGFQTGQSEAQSWKIYGYPSESPFNGNGLNACLSMFTRMDSNEIPPAVGFGCDLPGGTSGAPLIRRFAYNGGWVNGTYSYQYVNKLKETFSPYFGDGAWSVFCSAIKEDVNVTPPTGC